MATFEELGATYSVRLRHSKDPFLTAQYILSEINKMVYSGTDMPISENDKVQILKQIQFHLMNQKVGDKVYLMKDSDNSHYISLVQYMLSTLKGDKK